jgi:hypothetical protein
MAIDIKRVRFFDGQFLKEGDFKAEQLYHSHLRRRMNFLMFQQSGVLPLTPADLTLEVVSAPAKTFKIKAGTAIAQNLKEQEGREIILVHDSAPIDLVAAGILDKQVAVVSLHWEQITSDLSTEGEVSEDTRFFEQAVINVGLSKPATPIATGDPYVQIGTIVYDNVAGTVTVADTGREVALLRSALIATVPAPIITGVTGTTSAATGSVTMTIQGSNLLGATQVTFSDAAVTAVLGANTAASLVVTVTVGPGATPGPKSFNVQTASGIGFSPGGVVFTVLQPAPTITGMVGNPTAVVGGPSITMILTGTNLIGTTTVSFPGPGGANIAVIGTPNAAGSSVSFQVQANAGATAGLKTVHVVTAGGSADTVAPVGLAVVLPVPAPTITSISVHAMAKNTANTNVHILGTNLSGASSVVFHRVATGLPSAQVTASALSVNAAGTDLTLTVTVTAAADSDSYTFKVTTTPGNTADSNGIAGTNFAVL